MNLRINLSLSSLLCFFMLTVLVPAAQSQIVLFAENMGVPAATTVVTSYTGWQNAGVLTFSNGEQAASADVRTTNASSNYPTASGGEMFFILAPLLPMQVVSLLKASMLRLLEI